MKHIGLHCTKARNSRKGGGAHLDVRARRASGTRGTLAFARFSSLRATHATSLDHISHLTHATCPSGRSASTS